MQYRYFALVMLASMPFWLVGLVTDWVLLPGVPASAMMFAAPAIAAVFMLLGPGSNLSIWAWFRGHFSAPREKTPGWIFVAVLIPVVVLLITYTCAQFFGSSTPSPPEPAGIPAQFALLFLLFLFQRSWRNWGGRDTPSRDYTSATAPFSLRWSWGQCGLCGTGSHFCKLDEILNGLLGGP